MPKLSLVSHYYNHIDIVEQQLLYWESLPKFFTTQVEFVLIDDGSEEFFSFSTTQLDLKVFRITTPIAWNQPGARNLGAFNATSDWILYFDLDQRFFLEPLQALLPALDQLDTQAMFYFRSKNITDLDGKPLPFHSNTILVHLPTFKRLGLYDEDFSGHYGFDDLYMPQVWERRGGRRLLLNETDYFEDLRFGTTNLDRDLTRNHNLAQQKLLAGAKNSPGILRFEWEAVPVERRARDFADTAEPVRMPA